MNHSRTTTLLVGAAAIVIVVTGLRSAADIVGPLMLALALTIVFHPLRQKLERRLPGWAASIALLICAYVLILTLTLALVVSVGRLGELVSAYGQEADDFVAQIADGLEASGVGSEQVDAVADALDIGQLVDLTTSLMSSVLSVLSDLFFLVTLLLFLAFDSAHVSRLADGVRRHRPHLVAALSSFARGTRTYLGVSAVFGLIVAVIDTVLLWAMGIPGAFVWGVLAFVTNFIPNIGFVIGLVPPALIGLLEGGPALMLAVIVVYSVVNVIIQSVIQPRYVGSAVGLSTSLTFLSLVFWTWVLGPLGALLAVPMSLFFKAILVEADPGARWMEPVISGHPRDETPVETPSAKAREPRPLRRHRSS
jgi:AI-2 transport protein TqsA